MRQIGGPSFNSKPVNATWQARTWCFYSQVVVPSPWCDGEAKFLLFIQVSKTLVQTTVNKKKCLLYLVILNLLYFLKCYKRCVFHLLQLIHCVLIYVLYWNLVFIFMNILLSLLYFFLHLFCYLELCSYISKLIMLDYLFS